MKKRTLKQYKKYRINSIIKKPWKLMIAVSLIMVCTFVVLNHINGASALTATLRPDGEVTAGWAEVGGTDDVSCAGAAGHCSRIDEATLNASDYIGTGTNNTAGAEVAEFTMQNPGLASAPSVSQVTVYFNAATTACVNTSTACDRLLVSISMDNGSTYTADQVYEMSTSASTYSATFTGSWVGIDGLQVRITRQVRLSTGPGSANDDDVRLYQMYADFTYTGNTTVEQSAYRWYNNQDSLTPGSTLAAQDTAISTSINQQLRLRMLAHAAGDALLSGSDIFKLQYATKSGTCDTSFSGESYRDVTTSTPVAYYDNTTPVDGATISTTANDPAHSGHTNVPQTYVEANNISVASTVSMGSDGLWDFSLQVTSAASVNDYCVRMVFADGSLLNTYTVIPELQIPPTVTAISPSVGPTAGGTPFLLTGTFGPNVTVTIGGAAATNVFIVDGSTLIGVTPAGSNGAQDVVVTSGASSSTLSGAYTYSSLVGAHTKSAIADFALGTLTNIRNGTIEIGNGMFRWKNYTPSASGGSIPTNTYYYSVTALDRYGNETTRSIETPGVAVTGPSGSVYLKWLPIPGAYGYKIYRTTTSGTYGSSSLITTFSAPSSSTSKESMDYTDTAASTSSGQPPAVNNTTNAGLFMSRGTVPGAGIGTMSTGPSVVGTAANTVGQGAHFLERPDGTYLLIQGSGGQNTSIYNPATNTFSAGPSTGVNGEWGTHSFKLPDGRYYVMFGFSSDARYYDPVSNTFTAAPSTTTNPQWGAHVITLSNGNFLIIPGNNTTATSIYNTSNNTVTAGPTLPSVTYVGSHAIKRPNGTWLIVRGGSTGTVVYNESTNSFTTGPTLNTATTCNSGCGAIERPDGRWLILHGTASTTTTLYNPVSNTTVNGPALPGTTHDGMNQLELPDGRWLIIRGNASAGSTTNNTYIYNPYSNSFSNGPTLTANASGETPWLQRPDGTYLIVHGNSSATTSIYNAGWAIGSTGTYESEAIHPDESKLLRQISWARLHNSGIQVEYRTATRREGLSSATYTAATNGVTINSGAKNWVQLRIVFTRAIAGNIGGEANNNPGVWGHRSAKTYRHFLDPSLQSFSVIHDRTPNNTLMRHKKSFVSPGQLQHSTHE